MRSLLRHLGADRGSNRLGTMVVVGAGQCTEWPLLQELAPGRLVLIEPLQQWHAHLATLKSQTSAVQVYPYAVIPCGWPQADIYQLNNVRESSLSQPTGLFQHFPRLRVERRLQCEVKAVPDAMESWQIDATEKNILVVDAPGMSKQILGDLVDSGLDAFQYIITRSVSEPLYENEGTESEVREVLSAAGFDHVFDDGDAIAPYVSGLYKRNDIRVGLRKLTEELELSRRRVVGLEADLNAKEALRQSVEVALSQTRAVHAVSAAQVASLQRELDAVQRSLGEAERQGAHAAQERDSLSKLASERQTQLEAAAKEKADLAAARDAQAKLAADRQDQLEATAKEKAELTAARDSQAKLAAERQAQLEATAKEKADLAAARDSQAKLAAERQAQLEAAAKEKAELTAARDSQAKLAAERQAQLEAAAKEKADLAAARDAQAKLAAERQAQLEAAAKEKAELTAARDSQAKLAAEHLAKLQAETQLRTQTSAALQAETQKVEALTDDLAAHRKEAEETSRRQQLLEEELIKAEAQIELIKDLLLREQSL